MPMHAAQVTRWGESPKYVESAEIPMPEQDEVQITVVAAGLHSLVRARALGKHYSVKSLPHTLGVDGVGVTSDGQAVYFITHPTGVGSFVERLNLPRQDTFALPSDLDRHLVAAYVNPVMSSWMALRRRARMLPAKFTVLILGATTASGIIAASVARQLGAGKVIGCARNVEKLNSLGLDKTVEMKDPASLTDFSDVGDVDVVLDYVYGPAAATLLQSLNPSHFCQFVQIGSLAASAITLNAATLRSKNIVMMGSGLGSFTDAELRAEIPFMLEAMRGLVLRPVAVHSLSDIERQWGVKEDARLVLSIP